MLHELVASHREDIIRRCTAKAALRTPVPLAAPEIGNGVPRFLDQLVDALRSGQLLTPEIDTSATRHGHDLWLQGATASEVVHAYGDVCQAITDLAVDLRAPISTEDFRTLNGCLDNAIAGAVSEYGREQHQSGIAGESARATERLGFLAHEMRNLIHTALMAFEVLKTGKVGLAGTTGAVLHRTLIASGTLIDQSLGEVRLAQGIQRPEPFPMSDFIAEVASAAALEADARGVALLVVPVEQDVAVEADREVLAAVVANLLQNAFKFTRPNTTVTLRVVASAERVLVEIQDECGGLPTGDPDGLFRSFEQRGANRTGLGLGLAFSRWGVEANHGRIHARNLPDRGCVFTIDLPRCAVPAVATV